MTATRKLDLALFGLGSFLVALGLGLGVSWPWIYEQILDPNLALKNNSKSYDMWIQTPIPMYLDIYIFNWTNAAEFQKNSSLKPVVEEVGPFIFQEVHHRVNVSWNLDGSVSYNQTRNWTFLPQLSKDLKTPITNLNVIALGAAHATRYSGKLLQRILDPLLKTAGSLFVTKPAGEWLFQGMDLVLLDLLNEKYIKKLLPAPIPFDKFGFFYDRNMSASYDGHFKMLTGTKELKELSMVKEWNNQNRTNFFPGDCGLVNGSSGEIFPPIADHQTDFTMFITDVCSPLTLKYAKEETVEGIRGRQFVGDATMFDNGQSMPERGCFCEGVCQPAGTRNLTRCRQGAPVFVSFPHFYLADPTYLSDLDGLAPNKSLHEFRLSLDPTTGIPLDVRAQLQVNLLLQPYSMYKLYQKMPQVMVPMLWFSQRAHINSPLASQAWLLLTLDWLGTSLSYIIATVGVLVIVLRFWLRRKRQRDPETEPIISAHVDS